MDNYNTFVWLTHSLPPTQLPACLKIWKNKKGKCLTRWYRLTATKSQLWSLPVCVSLHVLPVSAWVPSRFSSSLRRSDNMHASSKLSVGLSASVNRRRSVGCCAGFGFTFDQRQFWDFSQEVLTSVAPALVYISPEGWTSNLCVDASQKCRSTAESKCFGRLLLHLWYTVLNLDWHWLDWQVFHMQEIIEENSRDEVKIDTIQSHNWSSCVLYSSCGQSCCSNYEKNVNSEWKQNVLSSRTTAVRATVTTTRTTKKHFSLLSLEWHTVACCLLPARRLDTVLIVQSNTYGCISPDVYTL